MSKGWYGEKQRHSLAAKGIKTGTKVYKSKTINYPAKRKTPEEQYKDDCQHDSHTKAKIAIEHWVKDEWIKLTDEEQEDTEYVHFVKPYNYTFEKGYDDRRGMYYNKYTFKLSDYKWSEISADQVKEIAKAVQAQDKDYRVDYNDGHPMWVRVYYFDKYTHAEPNKPERKW